jgi:hypothetical protein
MWNRYRFYTKSTDDYRPLVFNPKYPWWCSGEGFGCMTIVAYLPKDENLSKYWDDAYDIDVEERETITFTDRFPRPSYFEES